MLQLLKDSDLTAGEITKHFSISQPSVSHHLKVLKRAKLVWSERKGQQMHYSLNSSVMQELLRWLMEVNHVNDQQDGESG
ncbi:helix-turn-helix transcriptional regulator [Kroppenstedtia pulmonis]|uniref:Helix-turn-helix transcriptional regulator n=1 Tax=Kroppenstedtia pulmonis TaxID=1380685 RepID=A0A7D3YCD4_9BACL|nr:helix-turn-helix transcriptional regulator [Kroppenstedtia pulmonis]